MILYRFWSWALCLSNWMKNWSTVQSTENAQGLHILGRSIISDLSLNTPILGDNGVINRKYISVDNGSHWSDCSITSNYLNHCLLWKLFHTEFSFSIIFLKLCYFLNSLLSHSAIEQIKLFHLVIHKHVQQFKVIKESVLKLTFFLNCIVFHVRFYVANWRSIKRLTKM